MKCRNCQKLIQDQEYRKVAEWLFCVDCFEELLGTSSEKANKAKEDESDDLEIPIRAEPPKNECHVCKNEVAQGALHKLGIWEMCPQCYDILVSRPKQEVEPHAESDVADSDEKADTDTDVPIDWTMSVDCGGCGRTIPLGGGKAVDGKIFCPECHNKLAIQKPTGENGRWDSKLDDEATGHPATGDSDVCESCGRKVRKASLKEVGGFVICQACLSTDSETAMRIARERHRKRLWQMNENLAD